ncbi:MAG: carbohydrate ABC transporter permease [Devosiaceae bacterium]|nr:carbohydrate ABC transporter permease [Devosiaceae bacterium]
MAKMAGTRSTLSLVVNISTLLLVIIWVIPTLGLLISSFRDKDQLANTGWWTSLTNAERNFIARSIAPEEQIKQGDLYILSGNIFEPNSGEVLVFGFKSQQPVAFKAGEVAQMKNEQLMSVSINGDYRISSKEPFTGSRGKRIFYRAIDPPKFTLDNYKEVLFARGLGRSFINTVAVTIPSTIIPILVAAFAAYALAWMKFPFRMLLLATIVGLLVVPLQISLIPLLKMYTNLGIGKSYFSIWLAHTGFGLPLAIYLLYNYISGLPREIIESARVDGASDFDIFVKIILPLSFPALASFAIFQFLWVWNDLLVATVFLGNNEQQLVMTGRLRELLGSYGGNWEILTASAFVSIVVPLLVFFSLQKYLVRGLLAGSVKGG